MLRHLSTWILIMLSGIFGALAARTFLQRDNGHLFRYGKDLPEVLYLIEQAYVDDVKMGELLPGAFQGTLNAIDENASYIPKGVDASDLAEEVYRRTGLVIARQNSYPYLLAVAPESPAAAAGIKRGNYLRAVAGKSTRPRSLHAIHQLLLSDAQITVSVLKPGQLDSEDKTFTLGNVPVDKLSVNEIEKGIHLVYIPYTTTGLGEQLDAAVAGVPTTDKLVLDLRGHALGDTTLIDVLASRFLPEGELGWWRDSQEHKTPLLNPKGKPRQGAQLYILQDHTTSRGAEIFSMLARQAGVARLVGERTLGLPFWYETLALKNGAHIRLPTRDLILLDETKFTGLGTRPHLKAEPGDYDREIPEELLAVSLTLIREDDGIRDDGLKDEKNGKTEQAEEAEEPVQN